MLLKRWRLHALFGCHAWLIYLLLRRLLIPAPGVAQVPDAHRLISILGYVAFILCALGWGELHRARTEQEIGIFDIGAYGRIYEPGGSQDLLWLSLVCVVPIVATEVLLSILRYCSV